MALDGASGRGPLRQAIEGLLRTCVELDRQADEFASETREQARSLAGQIGAARLPGVAGLADEIAAVGTRMGADVGMLLSDGSREYVGEVHRLLGLLAPHHGVTSVPPLVAPPVAISGPDGIGARFPPGFAQDYVRDLLAAVERSRTLSVDEAGRVSVVPADDVDTTKDAVGGGFAESRRAQGEELVSDAECHAVEQHGPQIPDIAQLARLLWLKDPTGTYPWYVDDNGRVVTDHYAGPSTGGFTSPNALAKPLDALLEVAGGYDGGLNKLLDENATDVRVVIHVSAELAGLQPGDAADFVGAGTGTRQTRRDWIKAREYAMEHGGPPVYGVPYDPIAEGKDPGATVVLKKQGGDWHLVTCYPVAEPLPKSKRLEDLT